MPKDNKTPDPDGNKNDDNKTGDQKPEDQKTKDTISLTVDGETKDYTLDELKDAASKSLGADKKFDEAARLRQEAAKGSRVMELFESVRATAKKGETPSKTDINELAGLIGADPSELLSSVGASQKRDDEDEQGFYTGPVYKKGDKYVDADGNELVMVDDNEDKTPKSLALEDMPPEVQKTVSQTSQREMEETLAAVRKSCQEKVDKDEVLSKIIEETPDEELRKSRRDVLVEMMFEKVQNHVILTGKYGTDVLDQAVKTLRHRAKAYGIPTQTPGQPTEIPGLGPSEGFPAETFEDKPIQRVSSGDDQSKWVQQFVAKVGRRMRRLGKD